MSDIYHIVGNDIGASSTGDLATVSGTEKGRQRVLRRLITNPGDYPDHPDYGAGIAAAIGDVYDEPKLQAKIRGQMLVESVVAKTPEPTVRVAQIAGGITCSVGYVDANTGEAVALSFDISI